MGFTWSFSAIRLAEIFLEIGRGMASSPSLLKIVQTTFYWSITFLSLPSTRTLAARVQFAEGT